MSEIKEFKELKFTHLIDRLKNKDFALLAGNGLGLSHPKQGGAFKFDVCGVKSSFEKEFYENILYDNFHCPEEMMDSLRIELIFSILKNYQERINDSHIWKEDNLKDLGPFLLKFKDFYTLNYDGLIYRALLRLKKEGKIDKFLDGFTPKLGKYQQENSVNLGLKSSYTDVEKIIKEYKGKAPILYFLHGAFHLFDENGSHMIRLEARRKGENLLDLCRQQYESSLQKWRVSKEDVSNILSPLIVLCSRPHYKELETKENQYLSLCLQQIQKEKKVFCFGCAFKNDTHILKALLSRTDSLEKKALYLSYYKDRSTIEEKIKNLYDEYDGCLIDPNSITLVNVSDQKETQKSIWDA